MIYIEVLCEGESDVPVSREVLTRRFKLVEGADFQIHPHRGKGKLPRQIHSKPPAGQDQLLTQLPAKLRAYGKAESSEYHFAVVVLVDADNEDCHVLKRRLVDLYDSLDCKPFKVLFRIAVEETESWFIADVDAVRNAFPKAKVRRLARIAPDQVCGAWETLAECIGLNPRECTGTDKKEWATEVSPRLDLAKPKSPSMRAFVTGIDRLLSEVRR